MRSIFAGLLIIGLAAASASAESKVHKKYVDEYYNKGGKFDKSSSD